jgi:hypothetical protein
MITIDQTVVSVAPPTMQRDRSRYALTTHVARGQPEAFARMLGAALRD